MMPHARGYYIYMLTNYNKTVLYCGVTKNLERRIVEHYVQRGNPRTFCGRYQTFYLVYYESTNYVNDAIAREKQIKKWSRRKKVELIDSFNPQWKFLNHEVVGAWPPDFSLRSK